MKSGNGDNEVKPWKSSLNGGNESNEDMRSEENDGSLNVLNKDSEVSDAGVDVVADMIDLL